MKNNKPTIQQLKRQLSSIEIDIDEHVKKRDELDSTIARLESKASNLRYQIENLKVKKIVVSDHAVLRFVERFLGFDISEIKDRILSNELRNNPSTPKNGKITNSDGATVIIKNGVVVTVHE